MKNQENQDWKNIHDEFDEELQEKWINRGFTYQEAEKWIKFGKLKPIEANFAQWLRDFKRLGPKSVFNKKSLENEYKKEAMSPRKRLKIEDNKENIQKELFEAIKNNDVVVAKKIIDKKTINLNGHDEDGFTPLHLAVARDQKETVIRLLKNGANSNAKDSEGNTPLHFVAEQNNLELLKLLIEHESDVNAVNEYNWSILHSAASGIINEKEDWEVVEQLLKRGAKDGVKADNGFTARKVFLQKDYSYAEIYDNLTKKINSEKQIGYHQIQK